MKESCPHCGGRLSILKKLGEHPKLICSECECQLRSIEPGVHNVPIGIPDGPICPKEGALSFRVINAKKNGVEGLQYIHSCDVVNGKCIQGGHFIPLGDPRLGFNDYIPRRVA